MLRVPSASPISTASQLLSFRLDTLCATHSSSPCVQAPTCFKTPCILCASHSSHVRGMLGAQAWSGLSLPHCIVPCCMQQTSLTRCALPAARCHHSGHPGPGPWHICHAALLWSGSHPPQLLLLLRLHIAQRSTGGQSDAHACPCISHRSTGSRADLRCSYTLPIWLMLCCWRYQRCAQQAAWQRCSQQAAAKLSSVKPFSVAFARIMESA